MPGRATLARCSWPRNVPGKAGDIPAQAKTTKQQQFRTSAQHPRTPHTSGPKQAEGVGFEPTNDLTTVNGFRDLYVTV